MKQNTSAIGGTVSRYYFEVQCFFSFSLLLYRPPCAKNLLGIGGVHFLHSSCGSPVTDCRLNSFVWIRVSGSVYIRASKIGLAPLNLLLEWALARTNTLPPADREVQGPTF